MGQHNALVREAAAKDEAAMQTPVSAPFMGPLFEDVKGAGPKVCMYHVPVMSDEYDIEQSGHEIQKKNVLICAAA